MKKLIVIGLALLIIACGGQTNGNRAGSGGPSSTTDVASGTGIEIKLNNKEFRIEQRSAYIFSDDWTINMPDGKSVPTSNRTIVIANYDLDVGNGLSSTMKKMAGPDQSRIVIALQEKADVKKDMPLTLGEYVGKIGEFSKILNLFIFSYSDGTDTKKLISGSNSDNKGSVKITAVNGDTVTGEIDLSNTDSTIKGTFTAKIWKSTQK